MNFTGGEFWVFFAIVAGLYWLVRDRRWQNSWLLLVSYVFYGWLNPWLAGMLGLSTLADHLLAQAMRRWDTRVRFFLSLSLLLNLGTLGFFKYFDFFRSDLAALAQAWGFSIDIFLKTILLPAGLSFYTLKKLGYMIDVSRGVLQPTRSLVDFGLYVAFFPQITAGPIDRPQKLLPQIAAPRIWRADLLYKAWPLILMGLFKKIVVANSVSPFTSRIFNLEEPTLLLALTGALGFTLQILADFSAYVDLSRGVACLLGFDTSENFKSPYLALTPTEFWNRWHITLSNWLRDYIFFPVRRWLMTTSRPNWLIQTIPPLVTMLISGVWHGAGWMFLLWGLFHGLLIILYQSAGLGGNWKPRNAVHTCLAWLVMFGFIIFSWMIFAAPSPSWMLRLFSNPWAGSLEQQAIALLTLTVTAAYALPLLVQLLMERHTPEASFLRAIYYAVATAAIIVYLNSSMPDFIYFQF